MRIGYAPVPSRWLAPGMSVYLARPECAVRWLLEVGVDSVDTPRIIRHESWGHLARLAHGVADSLR